MQSHACQAANLQQPGWMLTSTLAEFEIKTGFVVTAHVRHCRSGPC
jgi:hypothetical protein